jgi:hypothetical protein
VKILKQRIKKSSGYALVIVIFFAAIGLMLLATTLRRSSVNSTLTDRRNAYFDTSAASEAATEKVISELSSDFLNSGAATVSGKMTTYHSRVPQSGENARWNKFQFKDKKGNKDATEITVLADWASAPLISQYQGLSGYAATYRITSYAQDLRGGHGNLTAAVQQDIQLAVVPVFQFTIFYNMDMEICPGPNMTIKGRVHSNGNLYAQPQAQLIFQGDVTSAQNIVPGKSPNDPSIRTPGTTTFNAEHDGGVNSLNMPLGTNNSPAAIHAIIEKPPNGESPNSVMGQQRLYNQADLIIEVYDNKVDVNGGNNNNGNGANVSWSAASAFISTNTSFYDYREAKTMKVTQIDVGKMNTWFKGQTAIKGLGSVWVADFRTQNAGTEPGIRLIDGQTLMNGGLTVATPDPLYVEGNYNVDPTQVGTANTSKSKPAALVADSINVLSGNWNDANGNKTLSNRTATDTTVNAAFLAGIVPSGNGYYSGGVENFPRFLESWSGRTFTYNGSMVVMFPSQTGISPWKGTGSLYNIYDPPTRNWNFDMNYSDPTKLPPITPSVRTAIRGSWVSVAPN